MTLGLYLGCTIASYSQVDAPVIARGMDIGDNNGTPMEFIAKPLSAFQPFRL